MTTFVNGNMLTVCYICTVAQKYAFLSSCFFLIYKCLLLSFILGQNFDQYFI